MPYFTPLPAKKIYSVSYDKFRGVDFSTDPAMIDGSRSPNAVNLISDAGGYPEKRVGWEVKITNTGKKVNGLFHLVTSAGATFLIAHCGTYLYAYPVYSFAAETVVTLSAEMNDAISTGFVHDGKLYILDGANYWVCDGATAVWVTGFVPTTVIGRAPTGGGTPLEAVNLISNQRINSFIGDAGAAEVFTVKVLTTASANGNVTVTLGGVAVTTAIVTTDTIVGIATKIAATSYTGWTTSRVDDTVTFTAAAVGVKADANYNPGSTGAIGSVVTLTQGADAPLVYQLDATGLTSVDSVVVAGVTKTVTTHYTVDLSAGTVTFTAGNAPPSGNGVDNVIITFTKTVSGYADKIKKCTIATWFGRGNDSRAFLSGNPDFPNMDWQSGLYDPTYFPDTGYTKVGADSSAIMGYLRQYDNQLIIKADNEQDATIYMRTAEIDDNGVAYFPLKQGVSGVGAISKYAFGTLRDDPLFLAKEGVFAPTLAYGAVSMQRVTQDRSFYVNARLRREANLNTAVSAIWNGLYLLCVNNRCYVADGRQKTGKSSTEQKGYEWFYWTNIPARVFLSVGDDLYFGDVDGRICHFMSDVDSNDRFADNGVAITASWASKLDDEGDFMLYKQLPRFGTGILIKPYTRSSVTVSIRTDAIPSRDVRTEETDIFSWGDIDFGEFGFDTSDAPKVVAVNSKVIKYQSIQFIIKNETLNEGFGCYGIRKRFSVLNYVK
jgi:hypothetical protein